MELSGRTVINRHFPETEYKFHSWVPLGQDLIGIVEDRTGKLHPFNLNDLEFVTPLHKISNVAELIANGFMVGQVPQPAPPLSEDDEEDPSVN